MSSSNLALDHAQQAMESVLEGSRVPEEVRPMILQSILAEICTPGLILLQEDEIGPQMQALAGWDGEGDPPQVAQDLIEMVRETAAKSRILYAWVEANPEIYLTTKAWALRGYEAHGGTYPSAEER